MEEWMAGRLPTSAWPAGASLVPNTERGRSTRTPGASYGTSTMDCCWCRAALGSVLPMNTQILHLARRSVVPHLASPGVHPVAGPPLPAVDHILIALPGKGIVRVIVEMAGAKY